MHKSVLLLLLAALLPACGLKGPLYLPAQKPAANPPATAAPASGTQPDDKANPAPATKSP
jgi:predicted small lipoprotein YifL